MNTSKIDLNIEFMRNNTDIEEMFAKRQVYSRASEAGLVQTQKRENTECPTTVQIT